MKKKEYQSPEFTMLCFSQDEVLASGMPPESEIIPRPRNNGVLRVPLDFEQR